jgi:hypothetical protein
MHFKKRILAAVLTLAMTLPATAALAPSSVYAASTSTPWNLAYYPNRPTSESVTSWSDSVIASVNSIAIYSDSKIPTNVRLATTVGSLGTHYLTKTSIQTSYLVTKGLRYKVTVKYDQNAGVKSVLNGTVN